MSKESEILAALDLGTKKITVAVAEGLRSSDEGVQIIGIGQAPSRGLLKGMIINLEQAVSSVSDAIADAESMLSGVKISKAVVVFSGSNVSSRRLRGSISLGMTSCAVTQKDIQKVVETALTSMEMPPNTCFLHTFPIEYTLDGNDGIENPLDMIGTRLEVDLVAVLVPLSLVQNVINCVEKAGVAVEGLLLKPLAEAFGTVTAEERSLGATVVSIGGGTTSLSVIRKGRFLHMAEISVGGDHITNDLSAILKVPFAVAEEFKKKMSVAPDVKPLGYISIQNRGNSQELDKAEIVDIIKCRLEELFQEVISPSLRELENAGVANDVVMSGGVMLTPGIEGYAEQILNVPVRIAEPVLKYQMQRGRNDCRYNALCGVFNYILEQRKTPYAYFNAPMSLFGKISGSGKNKEKPRSKVKQVMCSVVDLFRELF